MVLDVLERLKEQDPSLSYRRSCREGVCGSDGVNMNGKNGLACITPVSAVAKRGKLVLRPLPGLPVIRDLVVDMDQFFAQFEKVRPYLINDKPPPGRGAPAVPRGARPSSTASTSASCAPAAPPPALRFGGIRTSSSAQPGCCKPIASSPTAGIRPQRSAWGSLTTPTASFAAEAS